MLLNKGDECIYFWPGSDGVCCVFEGVDWRCFPCHFCFVLFVLRLFWEVIAGFGYCFLDIQSMLLLRCLGWIYDKLLGGSRFLRSLKTQVHHFFSCKHVPLVIAILARNWGARFFIGCGVQKLHHGNVEDGGSSGCNGWHSLCVFASTVSHSTISTQGVAGSPRGNTPKSGWSSHAEHCRLGISEMEPNFSSLFFCRFCSLDRQSLFERHFERVRF